MWVMCCASFLGCLTVQPMRMLVRMMGPLPVSLPPRQKLHVAGLRAEAFALPAQGHPGAGHGG